MRSKYFAIPFLTLLLMASAAPQQQQLSPPGMAEVTLNGKKVTIAYGRPSMRGRKIVGDLVPYGKVWRTGANAATTLTTEADINIGSTGVPAGKYTLYTLPSETTWKLIINKQTGQWGTVYKEEQDLARVDMQKSEIPQPVEQFTISLEKKGNDSANLILEWENTRLSVPVKGK